MNTHFKPCVNRTACTEDGSHCRACGRSHEEIKLTREIVNQLTDFLVSMKYENHEEFIDYLKKKVTKKINYLSKQS